MALLADRVKETTTTTGTGTVSLAGAPAGFQSFNTAFANGSLVYYVIQGGAEWEIGIGTTGTGTLARTQVLQSSNADALVPFSAGVKDVFCSYVADRAVTTVDAATLTNKTIDDYTNSVGANKTHFRIKATGTISKGSVVKATGYNPGEQAIEVAVVTSATDLVLGISEQALTTGQFGLAVVIGELFDVNTNGFTVGNIIYSNGAGGFTETKPASGLYQALGWIVRANASNGVIAVNVVAPLYVETATNTANTSVLRDGSGNFAAGTITATLSGTATQVSQALTAGSYLTSTGTYNGGTARTFAVDATDANTASKVVARDASGNFSAGTITATALNATTVNATTFDMTNLEVTNIKAKDGTGSATIADSTGVMTIASSVLTTTDINGGTIDGTTIGGSSAAAGTFTTVTATTGNITTVNATTVDATNVEVTNLKAKDGTSAATIADSTGVVTFTSTVSGSITGNAGTATALQTARNINGVSFNGTADITVTAAAGTLTGSTLASGVTASSLTSVGTLSSLTVSGNVTVDTNTLFVDAANNSVGVGTASPSYRFDISNTGGSAAGIRLSGNDQSNVRLRLENGGAGGVTWELTGGQTGANNSAFTLYDVTSTATRLSVDSSGNLAVDTNTLYVDAANNRVGVGTASPGSTLEVAGKTTVSAVVAGDVIANLVNTSATGFGLRTQAGGGSGAYLAAFNDYLGNNRLLLDASGNLGLGVTPSAWGSGWTAFQMRSGGLSLWTDGGIRSFVNTNTYFDGTNRRYVTTGAAAEYAQDGNTHIWKTAPSGTAGNAITFTTAMTLNANGNLSIGTTNSSSPITVKADAGDSVSLRVLRNASGAGTIQITDDPVTVANMAMAYNHSTTYGSLTSSAILAFGAGGSERARITSGGYTKASNDGTYYNSTGTYHELTQAAGDTTAYFVNRAASGAEGIVIRYNAQSPNGTGNIFLNCVDSAAGGTQRAAIRSNGGLANYQSNNVDLSDARTKTDITPAASMWSKIGALEIVTYKYTDQTHDDVNVGVIAQQVETVEPTWVDADGFGETPTDGVPLKTVYTKDITFAAIKALQEAMARIETLEQRVLALEA